MLVLLQNDLGQSFNLVPNGVILILIGLNQQIPDPFCFASVDFLVVDHCFDHQQDAHFDLARSIVFERRQRRYDSIWAQLLDADHNAPLDLFLDEV